MFCIHHVGGRAGTRGFPHIVGIERDVCSVIYDADDKCVEQISLRNGHLPSRIHVLPVALGARAETRVLHLTYDPYTSSLLQPLTQTDLYAALPTRIDYVLDEAFAVVNKVNVDVRRLDDVVHEEGVPPPDFLSIDVQGTELDVLVGCGELLTSISGVLLEVEFLELYKGQPLFGDVDAYMREHGFVLMSIDGFQYDFGPRSPVGSRSRGFWAAGEALYLRRPDGVNDSKLALAALAFGYAGWAARCAPPSQPSTRWETAVSEFHELCRGDTDPLPPTFAQQYSLEASYSRFTAAETRMEAAILQKLPQWVRRALRSPALLPIRVGHAELTRARAQRRRTSERRLLRRIQAPYLSWADRWGFSAYAAALRSSEW